MLISLISTILLGTLASSSQVSADPSRNVGQDIARAALAQVGVTQHYDPMYVRLAYPGGDVPIDRGVCTDVIVRAFRAIGVDLQVEVYEDMRKNLSAYPNYWRSTRPDRNIDHRRVPNLMRYFERHGKKLSTDERYEPGDIVAWRLASGNLHIGIVLEKRVPGKNYDYVVHNIGYGAKEEDVLHAFNIIGHYRWSPRPGSDREKGG